jgi:hypothetical protein
MTAIEITGDGFDLDRTVPSDTAFDALDAARESGEPAPGGGFQLRIDGDRLSYTDEIDLDAALSITRLALADGDDETVLDALVQLVANLTSKQDAYLRVLVDVDGRIHSTGLRERMEQRLDADDELSGRSLAGVRGGLKEKARDHVGEPIDEVNWSDERQECYYWIKDEYREPLQRAFDEADTGE